MNLRFDDIPTIESAGRLGRRRNAPSPIDDAYGVHRLATAHSLGQALSSLGIAAGFRAVELLQKKMLPAAAEMSVLYGARSPNYTTHADCGGFHYGGTCDEACFGFAPHHMDPFYCATCDEQAADPIANPAWNWHFVGSRGSIQYKDMEVNACNQKDAWKWKVGSCGECQESAIFRCHDGYKKYPGNDYWDPTICQGLVSCDGELALC